jgi:hypothetical protein
MIIAFGYLRALKAERTFVANTEFMTNGTAQMVPGVLNKSRLLGRGVLEGSTGTLVAAFMKRSR